jgi:hypothetical protein
MNQKLYEYILNKEHHAFRKTLGWDLATEYAQKGLSPIERMIDRFERLSAAETPVLNCASSTLCRKPSKFVPVTSIPVFARSRLRREIAPATVYRP